MGGVQHDPITYFDTFPLPVKGTLPVFATSNSTAVPDDACSPLLETTPDLSNKVVLIRRGTCAFADKLTNAAAKGAKVVVIYECVHPVQSMRNCSPDVRSYSDGSGFGVINVGNFVATLIQAADGEFVSLSVRLVII